MKYLLVFLFAIGVLTEASAQTGKGTVMIGGFFYGKRSPEGDPLWRFQTFPVAPVPRITISISPTVGYFVADHFAVGLQVPISRGWNPEYEFIYEWSHGVGPFVRYFVPIHKIFLFAEGGMLYEEKVKGTYGPGGSHNRTYRPPSPTTGYTSTNGVGPTEYHLSQTTYRAGVGAVWFVTPGIGVEGILSYRKYSIDDTHWIRNRELPDLAFNVGLQFYLAKGKPTTQP